MDTKLSLRLNVDELTNTHMETYEANYVVDGANTRETLRHNVPSLIQQLREAHAESMAGGGSSALQSKSPVNLSAFQAYATIASRAAEEYRRLTGTENHDTIEANIRGWAAHAQATQEELDCCLATTDRWINEIQALFQPARKWDFTQPCPACDQRFAYEYQDGERVRKQALTVTAKPLLAVCGNCGAEWSGEAELRSLERVLIDEKDRRKAG